MKGINYLIITVCLLSFSCQRKLTKQFNNEKINTAYFQNVKETAIVNEQKVCHTLLSPFLDSAKLVWKVINNEKYILTTTAKEQSALKYYSNNENGFYQTKNKIWVSLVPEMKEVCTKMKFGRKEGLNLRIEQLLGLKPNSNKTHFIEIWVRPEDLFRPCLDVEIFDKNCGLTGKDTTNMNMLWVKQCIKECHNPEANDAYPFTSLGYTYDWNKRNKKHIGLSEFIIKDNSRMVINNIVEICEYCKVKCK